MRQIAYIIFLLSFLYTDCIVGAKAKNSYILVDNNTLVLKGGLGYDILFKTQCFITKNSNIKILKDSFCDYEDNVLDIDNQNCSTMIVKGLY